jgi:hypothetical protein
MFANVIINLIESTYSGYLDKEKKEPKKDN